MALELKRECEKCGATLAPGGVACSYCESCAGQVNFVCPNCEGELVRRPRRKEMPTSGAAADA